jgi:hypothetical protein
VSGRQDVCSGVANAAHVTPVTIAPVLLTGPLDGARGSCSASCPNSPYVRSPGSPPEPIGARPHFDGTPIPKPRAVTIRAQRWRETLSRGQLMHALLGDVEQLGDLDEPNRLGFGHATRLRLMLGSHKAPGRLLVSSANRQRFSRPSPSSARPPFRVGSEAVDLHLGNGAQARFRGSLRSSHVHG